MDDESVLRAAARRGELDAMAELGTRLLDDYGLAQEFGMVSPYRERIDEGTGWLLTAAEQGHPRAVLGLAEVAALRGDELEQERWLRRAANDLGALERLHRLLLRQGRTGEATACRERMLPLRAEAGDPAAIGELAGRLDREGRREEAYGWYRRGAEVGHWYAMEWLGRFDEHRGDLPGAEQWYRRAVAAGSDPARVALGLVLERLGRLPEAERSLRDSRGGAWELAAFLERHGRTEEAETARAWAARLDDLRRGGAGGATAPDGAGAMTIATTVVITAAVLPFVQALMAKLAEGTYEGARALIRKLAQGRAKRVAIERTLLVIDDPQQELKLHLHTDEPNEALAALHQLEQRIKATGRRRGVRLVWDPETKTWQEGS